MPSLILTLAILGQCPGGVCPAPQARYQPTIVRPRVVYQAAPQACTVPRRGFKLFRKCR
jgi:hypothetical protein